MLIFKHNLESVELKLTKLAKKADKFNLPRLSWTITPAQDYVKHVSLCQAPKYCANPYHNQYYPRVNLELSGVSPVIAGWKLLARIEHFDKEQNLIHVVPGVEADLLAYQTRRICDHCQVKNNRQTTYVICNGSEVKQIGGNCLADYMRSSDYADQLIALAGMLKDFNDMSGGDPDQDEFVRSGRMYNFSTLSTLITCTATIRQHGYISKKSALDRGLDETETTSYLVKQTLTIPELRFKSGDILESDKSEAMLLLDWIKDQPADNDYMRNLKILCSQESIDLKHVGYLASLPACYKKATEKPADTRTSNFVGTPGDKLLINLTVNKIVPIESAYGLSHLVSMIDNETGNIFTWFASNLPREIEENKTVKLKGSIKQHTEYKGIKQTNLTRCRVA